MSFTFNVSDNTGKVRALLGDTTESTSQLTDEEISVYLTITSNDILASAAMGARAIAGKLARNAISKSAGNYSENKSGQYKAYLDLAEKLDSMVDRMPADAQVEEIMTDFNYAQIISNRVLRGETD